MRKDTCTLLVHVTQLDLDAGEYGSAADFTRTPLGLALTRILADGVEIFLTPHGLRIFGNGGGLIMRLSKEVLDFVLRCNDREIVTPLHFEIKNFPKSLTRQHAPKWREKNSPNIPPGGIA